MHRIGWLVRVSVSVDVTVFDFGYVVGDALSGIHVYFVRLHRYKTKIRSLMYDFCMMSKMDGCGLI